MADYKTLIKDKKTQNWLKASIAINIAKDGLSDFVNNIAGHLQKTILSDVRKNNRLLVTATCNVCRTGNAVHCQSTKKCPNSCNLHKDASITYNVCPNHICHNFATELKKYHRYNQPSFQNTYSTKWCSSAWELAKCFQPPYGYLDKPDASVTDFNGVVSVIINCKEFDNHVTENLSDKKNIFVQSRDVVNSIRHTATLQVEDADLKDVFTVMRAILSDTKTLSGNIQAQEAMNELALLEADNLIITIEDVVKLIQDSLDDTQCIINEAKHTNEETKEMNSKGEEIKKLKDDVNERIKEMTSSMHWYVLIDGTHKHLSAKLKPDKLLDLLAYKGVVTNEEKICVLEKSNEKNDRLLKLVRCKDVESYETFKSCLVKSDQEPLKSYLEEKEINFIEAAKSSIAQRTKKKESDPSSSNVPVETEELKDPDSGLIHSPGTDIDHSLSEGVKTKLTLRQGDVSPNTGVGSDNIDEGGKHLEASSVVDSKPLKSWKECSLTTDEQSARELLSVDNLPSSSELHLVCECFGQTSPIVQELCDKICDQIENQQPGKIVSVISACRKGENSIVFCVTTNESIDTITYSDYVIVQRAYDEHSLEEEEILKYIVKKELKLTKKDDGEIGDCVDKNYADLLKHSNISVISPSIVKSKGFATKKRDIVHQPCIALFVHFKGMIPLGEKPFPNKLGNYKVDVREGYFHYKNGGTPEGRHDKIKMGCCIVSGRSNKPGTLGGFVDHNEHGLCCFTCAHVMIGNKEMNRVKVRDGYVEKRFNSYDARCYQPHNLINDNDIGKLRTAILSTGNEDDEGGNGGQAGVDAALVEITQRRPDSGAFPDSTNNDKSLQFPSGTIASDIDTETLGFVKYGQMTEYTRGRCDTTRGLPIIKHSRKIRYGLRKQIGIVGNNGTFSEIGDSGSLVFTTSGEQIDAAVGHLVGGTTDHDYASPVRSVLEKLGVQAGSLHSFAPDGAEG